MKAKAKTKPKKANKLAHMSWAEALEANETLLEHPPKKKPKAKKKAKA